MKFLKIKNVIRILYINIFVLLFSLSISLAQDNAGVASQNFKETANNITNNVLTSAATLLITAAFVLFFYGVVVFILGRVSSAGDLKDIEKGKQFMLWGLIALFVMVSVWGIIKLAQDLLDIKGGEIKIQTVSFATQSSLSQSSSNNENTNPVKGSFNTINPNTNPSTSDAKLIDQYLNQYKCLPVGVVSIGSTYDAGFDSPYVVAFQQANNIPATGIIDKNTWDAFKSGNAKSCPDKSSERPLVVPGTTLNYQTANLIDKYLNQYNCFSTGYVNSIGITYDKLDSEYIKNFQRANNLTVDGKIGDATWKAFDSSTAKSCE